MGGIDEVDGGLKRKYGDIVDIDIVRQSVKKILGGQNCNLN